MAPGLLFRLTAKTTQVLISCFQFFFHLQNAQFHKRNSLRLLQTERLIKFMVRSVHHYYLGATSLEPKPDVRHIPKHVWLLSV